MIDAVDNTPAWPEQWGGNKPGMQAGDPLDTSAEKDCRHLLSGLKNTAIACAKEVSLLGLHKQVANRYIEPWSHITVLATASDKGLANFFSLRAHPMAQPEFQVLAYRMLRNYLDSKPVALNWGEWHIPQFANMENSDDMSVEDRLKIGTARNARLSYLTFDGEHSVEKDIKLHDDLATSGHFSPMEHVAQAINDKNPGKFLSYPWSNFDTPGNGGECGWGQYRKLLVGENKTSVDLDVIMKSKPDWIHT